ncbi:hypothetical protein [Microbacterium sp. KR10-403]|uniref:S10 family serine carboxypeptidase-like protein n=1 Tax=Microbacterium sp. KR10-403 TaxID=3158581 RepID=UPI0032E3D7EF
MSGVTEARPAVEHARTRHRIGDLDVAAVVETTPLVVDGLPVGDAWTYSYSVGSGRRPVLFLFNGGPGCSSVWLHLSGLGPFGAAVPADLTQTALPEEPLIPVGDSLLDAADLVFLDPVDTGFSRRDPRADVSAISGTDRDADLTTAVIRAWLVRHGRVGSPVFLLGESYGTIRAALTATRLREEGASVAGIAFLGQCLNAQETTQRPGNPAGFVAALPFLAATAWYHGRGAYRDADLDELVCRAHAFAIGPYAQALSQSALEPSMVDAVAGYTGLTTGQVRERRLRIDKEEFRTILLPGRVVGLTDTRYTVDAAPAGSTQPELDAADVRLDPVFTAASQQLFGRLGVTQVVGYRFAAASHEHWDYLEASAVGRFGGSALPSPFAVFDYPAHLSALLRADSGARLFFGTGHFDALTTVGSLEHLLVQYGLPASRVTQGRYPGGHMMYTDPVSRSALVGDLRAFLRG